MHKVGGSVAHHNARTLGDRVLLTNDAGFFATVSADEYAKYLEGKPAPAELESKGFIRTRLDFHELTRAAQKRHLLTWPGPSVHTLVVTLRCNMKCAYCHASVVDPSRRDKDMDAQTARQAVDFAFESPNPELMLEFQGGEPLLNWPVVKFIIRYARELNELREKTLHIGLVSNFSLLDREKLDFLIDHGVSFCTSLDGPKELHEKNRVFLGGNNHESVVFWLRELERRRSSRKLDKPNAICTITRFSLPRYREIIDQVVDLGLERIQLGPLDRIGFAKRSWASIGYTPSEFLDFYEKSLDYILELNRRGHKVYEKTALILLLRVLRRDHWRFPNGDGLCRLAYNYNGDIYLSEEARLLANEGDEFFKLGHVASSRYADVLEHPTLRGALIASKAEAQPLCSQCVYNPYCSILPVYNYATQGGIFGHMPANDWCAHIMGIFDLLFEKLGEPATRNILESWLDFKDS